MLSWGYFAMVEERGRPSRVHVCMPKIESRVNPWLTASRALWVDMPLDVTGLVLGSLDGLRVELPNVADIPLVPGR